MDISKKLVDTTFQMQKTTVIDLQITIDQRIEILKKLLHIIENNESEICKALFKDLHKSETESYITEINPVKKEINEAIKNLPKWIKTKKIKNNSTTAFMEAQVYYQPYGVCLVISPWNYPVNLSLLPLVGAVAAGNTAIIKLSEFAPNSAECIKNMLNDSLPMSYCKAFTGNAELSSYMASLPFDLIFFTGSSSIGKKVMQSAANNLTPVILELGGKSPCIVDADAEIKQAAKSIAWGKTINSGQTCIAPDYLLAHESIIDELIESIKTYWIKFYGKNPLKSKDYGRIVNEKHTERLIELINDKCFMGGNFNKKERYVEPTILYPVAWEDSVMENEIFGPILPVISFSSLDQVIEKINRRPKPLAMYYFSKKKSNAEKLIQRTFSGGFCFNDTIMHISHPGLPFGGVGASGMGNYHGKASFDTFSHKKSVLDASNKGFTSFRYPPYKFKKSILKKF